MPPHVNARAWVPLTPRATPIPGTPDTSHNDQPIIDQPYGETQLSTQAWERVFARALPGDRGYLVHRAWYALQEIPDGYAHPDGPLDAVALSQWLWWQRCTDYRDPDGTEIHHQALLDNTHILGPYLNHDDHRSYLDLPRTYADAYPLGVITWDGSLGTAVDTHPQLETVNATTTGELIGHLYVGSHRLAAPTYDNGIQRARTSVRQTLDNHGIAWHTATAAQPDISHVHHSRDNAISHLRAQHQPSRTHDPEEAAP